MEDDEDFETTRFGMGAIDRLIYTIGEEEMLPILSATIELMLGNNDWRYKYTAVMALSQIGEYIEDVDKISSVLHMIVGFIKHENPMMRYAACHAIGQISDDMQPKFQEKFGDAIFPELLSLLQTDHVPRVVSHSAAALTNFLEGMKFEQVQAQLPLLVELLLNLAVNGISLVKESALSALSSTVEIAKEKYEPFLNRTLEVLFAYYSDQQYSGRPYKQLKGQAIETLTIIASSVGPDMFRPAAGQLIQLMINLQSSQFEQTDPQKSYILAGWQRLCLVYGRELGSHLSNILPGLFVLVENVIREEILSLNDDEKEVPKEGDDQNINTHDTEEAEVAISMLNVFIEQLKELYNPYVEKTVGLLCNIIKEHPNEDVKEEACKCLPNLIIAVKTENSPLAVNLAKLFMGTLVETMEKEYDSQIVIVELETLKSVLEELGLCFLNEQEIKDFS
jgi:importin-5